MEDVDRLADPRDAGERGKAGILLLADRQQALHHEGAVDAVQRHDVADRGQRDQVEIAEQVGRRPAGAAFAQFPGHLDQRQEGHAGGAKMALPGEIVLAVGIDDGNGVRQRAADLMMVEHDDVGAGRLRRVDRGRAVGAAVDGDDQRGAAADQLAHRLGIGAVAFEDAVGDVDFGRHAEMREEALEQRRRGRAVDVVVAEDRHALAPHDRVGDARGGLDHVGQRGRVGQQVADRRIEEFRGVFGGDAARREHARDDLGHAMALRDGQRDRFLPDAQPVAPGDAAHRAPHVQKEAFLAVHRPSHREIARSPNRKRRQICRDPWRALISRTVFDESA